MIRPETLPLSPTGRTLLNAWKAWDDHSLPAETARFLDAVQAFADTHGADTWKIRTALSAGRRAGRHYDEILLSLEADPPTQHPCVCGHSEAGHTLSGYCRTVCPCTDYTPKDTRP